MIPIIPYKSCWRLLGKQTLKISVSRCTQVQLSDTLNMYKVNRQKKNSTLTTKAQNIIVDKQTSRITAGEIPHHFLSFTSQYLPTHIAYLPIPWFAWKHLWTASDQMFDNNFVSLSQSPCQFEPITWPCEGVHLGLPTLRLGWYGA